MSLLGQVRKTYKYGQIFGYERSFPEICVWLLGSKKVSRSIIRKKLGVKKELYLKKKKINPFSQQKIMLAKKILTPVLKVPLIYFIGITGSVSANNAKKNDDIDIFIVTAPHTLWLVRPVFLFFLELVGVRRRRSTPAPKQKDLICPNLWMDATNIQVPQKNQSLYTAHETLQVLPIYNKKDTYQRFIKSNSWVKKYLANAYSKRNKKAPLTTQKTFPWVILSPLNFIFFVLQLLFMSPLSKGENVSYGQAFFHDQEFSKKILSRV